MNSFKWWPNVLSGCVWPVPTGQSYFPSRQKFVGVAPAPLSVPSGERVQAMILLRWVSQRVPYCSSKALHFFFFQTPTQTSNHLSSYRSLLSWWLTAISLTLAQLLVAPSTVTTRFAINSIHLSASSKSHFTSSRMSCFCRPTTALIGIPSSFSY